MRYVDAFERYDMAALDVPAARRRHPDHAPLRDVAAGDRRPGRLVRGAGRGCADSVAVGWANGCPAFAQYRVDPAGGPQPWALQVLELRGGRIEAIHAFLDTEAFDRFGFPDHLD